MSSDHKYHIDWRVYPNLDLIQMSGILSGLTQLERTGVVSLTMHLTEEVIAQPYAVMQMAVTQLATGSTRNVVFDFYDAEARLIEPALNWADVYFKRQYGPATVASLSPELRSRVRPLGLTLSGFTAAAWRPVAAAIRASLLNGNARRLRGGLGRALIDTYRDVKLWAASPRPDAAMLRPGDRKGPHIVFQPRLWETTPGSGDVFAIANEDRIMITRALRQAFPDERAVGLVHSPYARAHARELLLDSNVTTGQYLRQLRESLVAVNCVGLSGSVGWKFAEYLAAGNAIVSQPIDKCLLAPIEQDIHYLAYHDPDECVKQCRRFLEDPGLATRMGKACHDYYLEWTHPPAHVGHLLRLAFE